VHELEPKLIIVWVVCTHDECYAECFCILCIYYLYFIFTIVDSSYICTDLWKEKQITSKHLPFATAPQPLGPSATCSKSSLSGNRLFEDFICARSVRNCFSSVASEAGSRSIYSQSVRLIICLFLHLKWRMDAVLYLSGSLKNFWIHHYYFFILATYIARMPYYSFTL